jgi:YbbR domain-containing protein
MALPAIIRHNLGLKVVSFILATFLWLVINYEIGQSPSGNEVAQEFKYVRVRVLTDVKDHKDYQVIPSEVSLTVSGDPLTIRRLREKDFQVFINMSESTDFLSGYIRKVEVVKPIGINLIKVDPPIVRVEMVKNTTDLTEGTNKKVR